MPAEASAQAGMLDRFMFVAQRHSKNKKYQLWTHENHAVHLYSHKFMREKLEYLHNNPVRAGIVEKPEDYLYSGARNYAGMRGLIEIVHLDLPWITY